MSLQNPEQRALNDFTKYFYHRLPRELRDMTYDHLFTADIYGYSAYSNVSRDQVDDPILDNINLRSMSRNVVQEILERMLHTKRAWIEVGDIERYLRWTPCYAHSSGKVRPSDVAVPGLIVEIDLMFGALKLDAWQCGEYFRTLLDSRQKWARNFELTIKIITLRHEEEKDRSVITGALKALQPVVQQAEARGATVRVDFMYQYWMNEDDVSGPFTVEDIYQSLSKAEEAEWEKEMQLVFDHLWRHMHAH